MAYGIMDVVKDFVAGTTEYASTEEQQRRLKFCHTSGPNATACDKLVLGVCKMCGCVAEHKVKYAESECPKGLWKPVTS